MLQFATQVPSTIQIQGIDLRPHFFPTSLPTTNKGPSKTVYVM
jgi:hypothetical protein